MEVFVTSDHDYSVDFLSCCQSSFIILFLLFFSCISILLPLALSLSLQLTLLLVGIFWSVYPVIIVDLIGEENKDHAVSQAVACNSIAWIASGPLGGM